MLALISGGDRGIGFAIARRLAQEGNEVIIFGRDRKRLEGAKARLSQGGATVHALHCDLTKGKDIDKLKDEVSSVGDIDILVNNAGVAYGGDFTETTREQIDEMLHVNLRGLMLATSTFLPGMIGRGRGIIINISSGAGKTGFPGLAVYCATKFGVIGFTEALAGEVEEQGVRVYAICPGSTQTDMWDSLYPGEEAEFVPEDVAIEVSELIKNNKRITPGSAIDVRKHVD